MSLLKVLLFGIITAFSIYFLGIYLKGSLCHLQHRINEKIVLITGANTGIGLETAVELAKRGGIIHMGCRDQKKCKAARDIVLSRTNVDENRVYIHSLDLSSIKSIVSFVKQFKMSVKKLNILINNAGIMMTDYELTEDGFERQIGVNHLGHFLLTNELLDIIKIAEDARIIIVSSLAHDDGSINTTNINLQYEDYGRVKAYAQSKLANILHAKYLAKMLKKHNVAVVSLHPGVVNTELLRYVPGGQYLIQYGGFLLNTIMRTPFEGSQTSVCCAVDPDLYKYSGEYFNDCRPVKSKNPEANNDTLADILWEQSMDHVNYKLKSIIL